MIFKYLPSGDIYREGFLNLNINLSSLYYATSPKVYSSRPYENKELVNRIYKCSMLKGFSTNSNNIKISKNWLNDYLILKSSISEAEVFDFKS